ncbi:unnamed protein product [Diamesa serratosioi]
MFESKSDELNIDGENHKSTEHSDFTDKKKVEELKVRTTQNDIANTVTQKINNLKIDQEDSQSKVEKNPKKRVRERKKKLLPNMESHSEPSGDSTELLKKLKDLRMTKAKLIEPSISKNISNLSANIATSSKMSEIKKQELINNPSKQAFIIEGEVRVNNKNLQECYISQSKGRKDICISKLTLRKYAFNGDLVKVLVKSIVNESSESDLKTTIDDEINSMNDRNYGCVLEIIQKRHSRRVVGSFAAFENFKKKRKHHTFKSRDSKVPNIQVYSTEASAKWLEGSFKLDRMLFVAEITDWLNETPVGHVVELIGEMDMLKTENVAILSQNNLDATPFTQEIIDQLPKEPYTIAAHEFTYREDLRKKCIFSIDPETARDLDDAVSCEILSNGNLEVGVHISDVSFFIKENSELDMLVKEKATTIYLVDNVYHMIPVPLCLLCSLLPGSDKLAFSVFWEIEEETAEILSTRFTRSIVNSCAQLSYDHAQMIIENPTNWMDKQEEFPVIHNNFTINDIAHVTLKLQKLALIMRNNRKEKGALKIDQPKLAFSFNKESDAPTGFFKYPMKDSNRLIEEFMLLSNISVAKFIFEKFPLISLLRNHNAPNSNGVQKLLQNFMKFGVEMDITSSKTISESIEKIVGSAPSTAAMNAVINCLTSKTMTRAKYFCSETAEEEVDFWHYALSIPIYTHFTSPIRRYADILVHRVLSAALNYEEPPTRSSEEIQKLATVCNIQKYNAKIAGEDSCNLYFMHFVKAQKTMLMKIAVMGVYEFNLEVILVETGHCIKIYYKNLEQFDNVIVKQFSDKSPPYITVLFPSFNNSTMRITFGSELDAQLEVYKNKLVINKIFHTKN